MNVSQWMAHLSKSLSGKAGLTGKEVYQTQRKIFGVCIAYLKDFPREVAAVSEEIDRLIAGRSLEHYVSGARVIINNRRHEKQKVVRQPSPNVMIFE